MVLVLEIDLIGFGSIGSRSERIVSYVFVVVLLVCIEVIVLLFVIIVLFFVLLCELVGRVVVLYLIVCLLVG